MSTPIEPVVQLFDADTLVEYDDETIIDFGEVKAGDASDHKTLHLWNNKGNEDDVASTMRDVELFILDRNDDKDEPIVKDGWIHVKCTSGGATGFTDLTDTNTIPITAADQDEGEILGSTNSGSNTDTDNYAVLEVYAQIVTNVLEATHGEKPFSLAFRYFFT